VGLFLARRTIAIGDIHGCADALAALIDAIAPGPSDTIITLGDHIDRGPNSRSVIDRLIKLSQACRLVSLIGNHEAMLADALRDKEAIKRWLSNGGIDTLRSYGWSPGTSRRRLADWIPVRHRDFLAGCRRYHETETHIFVHAGYVPELPLDQQPDLALTWRVTDARTITPHCSGKVAIVGHTPQYTGEVLDLGFLLCIDTNCHRGGWLTAYDIESGRFWQAGHTGKLRRQ
jgi:serine/threonine protein phosphatase 1